MLTTPRAKTNGPAFLLGWLLGLGIVGAIVLAIAVSIGLAGGNIELSLYLISLSGMPSGVTITLGTVDDSSLNGGHTDQSPTVTGYGL